MGASWWSYTPVQIPPTCGRLVVRTIRNPARSSPVDRRTAFSALLAFSLIPFFLRSPRAASASSITTTTPFPLLPLLPPPSPPAHRMSPLSSDEAFLPREPTSPPATTTVFRPHMLTNRRARTDFPDPGAPWMSTWGRGAPLPYDELAVTMCVVEMHQGPGDGGGKEDVGDVVAVRCLVLCGGRYSCFTCFMRTGHCSHRTDRRRPVVPSYFCQWRPQNVFPVLSISMAAC